MDGACYEFFLCMVTLHAVQVHTMRRVACRAKFLNAPTKFSLRLLSRMFVLRGEETMLSLQGTLAGGRLRTQCLQKAVTEIGKSVCVVKRKPEAAGCAQRAVKSCPKRNSPRTFGNVHASNPTDDKNATGVMSTVYESWHAAEQPSERYRVSSRYGNERATQQCCVHAVWEAVAARAATRAQESRDDVSKDARPLTTIFAQPSTQYAVAQSPAPPPQVYTYICPHCGDTVQSTVLTGHVNHKTHCGHQFRVEGGTIRPARTFQHLCPTCGVTIYSTQEVGRIQSKHKNLRGKECKCKQWTVKRQT